MTHSAGDDRAYAEQLFTRICRKWAVPPHEILGNSHVGRRLGDNIVRSAIIAEFTLATMTMYVGTPALVLNRSMRTIKRFRSVIRDYQTGVALRPVLLTATTQEDDHIRSLSSGPNVTPGRMCGYDRAAHEELISGGGF